MNASTRNLTELHQLNDVVTQQRRCIRLLGGSWVVISGVISPLIWVIIIVTLLITPLITTHEPPSKVHGSTPGALEASVWDRILCRYQTTMLCLWPSAALHCHLKQQSNHVLSRHKPETLTWNPETLECG